MNNRVRPRAKKGTLKRLIKMLFKSYPFLLTLIIVFILLNAVISSIPAVFSQNILAIVEKSWQSGDWNSVAQPITRYVILLAGLYGLSMVAGIVYQQLLAYVSSSFMAKVRIEMFEKMQTLPLKFFDTHSHGDIMSHFTNDIDTLRQLISQSIPALISSIVVIVTVLSIMLFYSIWMTLVILIGVLLMILVTKSVGGRSGRFFKAQQISLGKTEGYIEEMIHGLKVVKVFNHEQQSQIDFDKLNDQLAKDATKANMFANILMPILQNIGNILYVVIAIVGGIFISLKVSNFSISGLPFSISILIPFLNMTRQFTGNISNSSMQINSIVMAIAGASRVFELLDQQPEVDEGQITLVPIKIENDQIVEMTDYTGQWAWKHPATNQYTLLAGDVRMNHVDFGYSKEKRVLKDVTLYAQPGQKVAFVGATGAGKTTITNLINRFYDIEKGEILYDGINIKEIKKADLRRSLGMVLQETNLFTGTIMDNLRYGNLHASDQACIEAAKLSGADYFISLLKDGYQTVISGNSDTLSQGQRQMIAIARAEVANPPVMILDEATSSIDTRTEEIVQKGMDELMKGRTTFVIAHRLSTVQNSDVIMVLEQGQIIERGSHDNLLQQKGKYHQLYTGGLETD